MNSRKDFSDIFDEDFEVTYDEEPDISRDFSDSTSRIARYSRNSPSRPKEMGTDGSRSYEDVGGSEYSSDYDSEYDSDYDRRKYNQRKRSGVHLAAPIQKGGRTLSRISGIIIRQFSLILILCTTAYVIYTFWRASVPYGDVEAAIRERALSQTLAAYFSVAAVFLFFEMLSFFWAMTRVRVRDAGGIRKEDTGRGLTSFIIVFVSSYLAFLLNRFIPSAPDILYGFKGGLLVYGSMHNTLLGLCAAGVVSCLIRKYRA